MFKKLIYTAIAGAVVATFLFGRDAISYVRTSAGCIKDTVRDSVPVRFEFQRARNMVESLQPEIRKNMMLIAREEVEIERLRKQVTKLEETQTKDHAQLTRLTEDVQSGSYHLVYHGRRYSVDQVKADVQLRLKRAKTNDVTLESLRKVLHSRERSLAAAKEKLEQTLALKQQALVEITNLEARQKMIEVQETAQELSLSFDDTYVSRTRDMLDQLATRIEVAEKLVNSETEYHGEIPLEEPVSEDIVAEAMAYLNDGLPEVATVAEFN